MKYLLLTVIAVLTLASPAGAYGVLTHEAIIDISWKPVIVPLLKQKFPNATDSEIENAHAYAYGGAISPDMGYFPFGSHFFSDLVHYVRTGDFVIALQKEATNVNEYAFALGALSHYNADKYGHSRGVNVAEPMVFKELKAKYGDTVTYEESPTEHVRTEIGFDILQTARGNYASDAYHRFISFEVADSLLRRAFKHTYDIDIDSVFKNFPRSVRTFRWGVKDIFPQLTKAAWKSRRSEIQQLRMTKTARSFHYKMRRREFYTSYGKDVEQPRMGARMIAGILLMLPKVGPLKSLKPVIPGPDAEKIFIRSFDTSVVHYRMLVQRAGFNTELQNINFDTGQPTLPGKYQLTDKAYFQLLSKLEEKHFAGLSDDLKRCVVSFFEKEDVRHPLRLSDDEKAKVKKYLADLESATAAND